MDDVYENIVDYKPSRKRKILIVFDDMLPNYRKKIADKYKIKVGDVKKLVPNLGNKTKYIVHYRNLLLHLSLGMKLTKFIRC